MNDTSSVTYINDKILKTYTNVNITNVNDICVDTNIENCLYQKYNNKTNNTNITYIKVNNDIDENTIEKTYQEKLEDFINAVNNINYDLYVINDDSYEYHQINETY
jgi:hypothetical protein